MKTFIAAGLYSTLLLLALLMPAPAQTVGSTYSSSYSLVFLGPAPGAARFGGGLTLEAGHPNILLFGFRSAIYSVGVIRDSSHHITGFSGTARVFASAPGIEGSLAYAPNGDLLYNIGSTNQIGEIKPGSAGPDKIITPISLPGFNLQFAFVPPGFAGAGKLALTSYYVEYYYTTDLVRDTLGTYDLTTLTKRGWTGKGIEGIAFIPAGSPNFPTNSIFVMESDHSIITAYTLNANGSINRATRSLFVDGHSNDGTESLTNFNEIASASVDPLTGDFLFFMSNKGKHQIVEVRGFSAPFRQP